MGQVIHGRPLWKNPWLEDKEHGQSKEQSIGIKMLTLSFFLWSAQLPFGQNIPESTDYENSLFIHIVCLGQK